MQQQTPTIKVSPRQRTGTRYAQRLRKSGQLPAVIYGHKIDPVHISMDEKEILHHLHQGAHVMKLDVEGGKTETCLIKDLQFGYLGDNVIHLDFTRVNLDEEVTVNVRLRFVGQPAAATKEGAIINTVLNELEVICKVSDIPEEIIVDIAPMESHYLVSELHLPPGVRTEIEPTEPVVTISYVHEVEETAEEVEISDEAAEPEVITEAKPEDEASEETTEES